MNKIENDPKFTNRNWVKKVLENCLTSMVNLKYIHEFEIKLIEGPYLKITLFFDYEGKNLSITNYICYEKIHLQPGSILLEFPAEKSKIESMFRARIEERIKGEETELRGFKILQDMKLKRIGGVCEVYRASKLKDVVEKSDVIVAIEFIVIPSQGQPITKRFEVGIQLKSSRISQKKHIERYTSRPSLFIDPEKPDSLLIEEYKKIFDFSITLYKMRFFWNALKESSFDESLKQDGAELYKKLIQHLHH